MLARAPVRPDHEGRSHDGCAGTKVTTTVTTRWLRRTHDAHDRSSGFAPMVDWLKPPDEGSEIELAPDVDVSHAPAVVERDELS